MAAARRFWAHRGGVARGGGSSARQQEGEELAGDAWEPAHCEVMAGKAGKAGKPLHGADVGAVGGRRRKTEQGGWRWKTRVVLQFPKIPGTFL